MEKISYLDRFRHTLCRLVGSIPDPELCQQWLDHTNDDLQEWVMNCLGDAWPQGIAVIEAAMIMADQPKEGMWDEICYKRPTAIEMKEELDSLRLENERLTIDLEDARSMLEQLDQE